MIFVGSEWRGLLVIFILSLVDSIIQQYSTACNHYHMQLTLGRRSLCRRWQVSHALCAAT